MTERYSYGRIAVFEIWSWYKRAIREMELPGIPSKYWRYARFDDGTPIPKVARLLYRSRPDLISDFPDPFHSGTGSFQEWFREHGSEPAQPSRAAARSLRVETAPGTIAPAKSIAAVVHAFYPELLPEICDLLARYTGPLKLFVTTTSKELGRVEQMLRNFERPFELTALENRGRDILPFLRQLQIVFAEGHDYILKIHTKRSRHRNDGDLWRRELLGCLADPAELTWIVERLQQRPDVGIVGPIDHVLDIDAYWGSNQAKVLNLAERLGIGQLTPDPNVFVAGSMFVARREALLPILSINLADDEFETEIGPNRWNLGTRGGKGVLIQRSCTWL